MLLLSRKKGRVLLAFSLFILFSVSAQAQDSPVYLKEGPDETSGLPFIYPNAMRVYTGFYGVKDSMVRVMFTSEDFIIPEEWKHSTCGGYKGYTFNADYGITFSGGEVFYFYYTPGGNEKSWSVFIIFEKEVDCPFVFRYLKRFIYLQRDWDSTVPPLMPAVLE